MTVCLWKGYHGPELFPLIQKCWDDGRLLVLCPPLLRDFSFLSKFAPGPLELFGAWTESERLALRAVVRHGPTQWPEPPRLGVFTSGTLSLSPRLVLYSRRNLMASLNGIFALFERSRIAHVFCYPQAFHTFGLTLGYLAAHVFGWRLHTPEGKYQPASHAQRIALREENVLTLGTPTHFYDLLQYAALNQLELIPSYSCILGGASVSRELWWRVKNDLRISAPSIGYGCTEAAPGITHLPPGQAPLEDDEIGCPLGSLQAQVLGGEAGVEISGSSLCLAIIQQGEIEFPSALCIRDRVEVRRDGIWLYRGRLDLLMNRGGAKYSLEAIEKTLHEQLGMAAVACTLRDMRLGEDLGLAIMHSPSASAENLLASAQNVLKDVFALRLHADKTRFVAELPLNECSKLDRKSIWTLFADEGTISP